MPSTYTQNLGIEQPATGEQAGVWGNTCNSNFNFFDTGIDGNLSIALSANAYSLVTQAGASSEGRNKVVIWTGTLTAQATVNITPQTAQKLYFMVNQTTGGFPIMFQQGTGAVVTLQPGYAMAVYCDGGGGTGSVHPVLDSPQFTSVLCQNLTVSGSFVANAVTMASAIITSLTINPGGGPQAPYDVYYRGLSGSLTQLPIGTVGQALTVTASGPAWTTITLALGSFISGAVPYSIFFYANGLSQDTIFDWLPGVGLGIGLGTTVFPRITHSLHIGYSLNPEIWLDTNIPQTQWRQLTWATNGAPRWSWASPAVTESGANVGSDLGLASYNDAGAFISWCFFITRASGNITIGTSQDLGAKLFVLSGNTTQPALTVRGVASQAYLQTWQNSAGQVVASVDGSGNFTSASSGYVQYTLPSGRVDLNGTVPGHPLSALHIGHEPGIGLPGGGLRGTIALESIGLVTIQEPLPPTGGVIRIYYAGLSNAFVIQYVTTTGLTYYASMNLPSGAPWTPTWSVSTGGVV